jgi:hypothetical protein
VSVRFETIGFESMPFTSTAGEMGLATIETIESQSQSLDGISPRGMYQHVCDQEHSKVHVELTAALSLCV